MAPCSATSAGRANSENVTNADTGLPGSPNTSLSPAVPNQVGLPGCSDTPQNTSLTPSAASAGLTWSWGPTDTPPETIATSACSSAWPSACSVAARSSRRRWGGRGVAPQPVLSATSIGALELWISPGPSGSPGARSSSPVHSTWTVGRRDTDSSPRPAATAAPSSAACRTTPADSTSVPALHVLAGVAHVLTRHHGLVDRDGPAVGVGVGVLLADHGGCALGHRRTG